MEKNNVKIQRGFTLIELITVIVILVILSAFALSKFADLSSEAELSSVEGVAGALLSAVSLVKITFDSQSFDTRVQDLPNFGDGDIDTNNSGYPIGIDKGAGNENIGQGDDGCVGVWTAVLDNPPTVANGNNNSDYRSYRHGGNTTCSYVYRGNGDTGNQNTGLLVIRYDSTEGTVVVCGQRADVTSC